MTAQVTHIVTPGARRMRFAEGTYIVRAITDRVAIELVRSSAEGLLGVLDDQATAVQLTELIGFDFVIAYTGVIASIAPGYAMLEFNPSGEVDQHFQLISRIE